MNVRTRAKNKTRKKQWDRGEQRCEIDRRERREVRERGTRLRRQREEREGD
jgi:hypothetical protein